MYVFFPVAYRYVLYYCMTCRAVFGFLLSPAHQTRHSTLMRRNAHIVYILYAKIAVHVHAAYTPTRMRVGCADVPDLCFPVFEKF